MTKFYRFIKVVFSRILLWHYRIKVEGAENEPALSEGAYLMCANHIGALDPFCVAAALWKQQMYFMAKKELFRGRVLGAFLRNLGAFPVDRSGGDVSAIRETLRLLAGGHSVGLFPQGTRHPGEDPRLTEVKAGAGLIAIRAKVPVLPVLIVNDKNKMRFRRKTRMIIGKPISYEELMANQEGRPNYMLASQTIFDRICSLDGSVAPTTDAEGAEAREDAAV